MTDGLEQPAGKGQSTSEEVETEPTDLRASLIEMAVVEHKESAEQFRQTSEQRQEHLHKLGIGTAGRSGAALRRALDGVEAPFAAKTQSQQPRPSGESTGQKLNEGFQPVQDDAQVQRGALRVRPPKKCVECGSTDTPMWRTHPVHGRGTLCNACGVKLYRQQCKERVQREKTAAGIKADEGDHPGSSPHSKRLKTGPGSVQLGWDSLTKQEGALCVRGCQFVYRGQASDGAVEPRVIHSVSVHLKLPGTPEGDLTSSHLLVLDPRGLQLAVHHMAEVDARMEYDNYLDAGVWDSREGWWLLLPSPSHAKSFQVLMRYLAACKLGFPHPPPLPHAPPTSNPLWVPPEPSTAGAAGTAQLSSLAPAGPPAPLIQAHQVGGSASLEALVPRSAALADPPLEVLHGLAQQLSQRMRGRDGHPPRPAHPRPPPIHASIPTRVNHSPTNPFHHPLHPSSQPLQQPPPQKPPPGRAPDTWQGSNAQQQQTMQVQEAAADQQDGGSGVEQASAGLGSLAAVGGEGRDPGGSKLVRMLSNHLRRTAQPQPGPLPPPPPTSEQGVQGTVSHGDAAAKLPPQLLSQLELLSRSARHPEGPPAAEHLGTAPANAGPPRNPVAPQAVREGGFQGVGMGQVAGGDSNPGGRAGDQGPMAAPEPFASLPQQQFPSQLFMQRELEGGGGAGGRWRDTSRGQHAAPQQGAPGGLGLGWGRHAEEWGGRERGPGGSQQGMAGAAPPRAMWGGAGALAGGAALGAGHHEGQDVDEDEQEATQAQDQSGTDAALRLLVALQQQQQQ